MSEVSGIDSSEHTRRDTAGMLTSTDVRTGYVSGLTFTNKVVQYAVVGNRAVFEGDIVLGTVDELAARSVEREAALRDAGPSRAVVVVGEQYRRTGRGLVSRAEPEDVLHERRLRFRKSSAQCAGPGRGCSRDRVR